MCNGQDAQEVFANGRVERVDTSEPAAGFVHDPVWSNAFLLLPVLSAPGLLARALALATGTLLMVASASYHWRYDRKPRRFDVTIKIAYLGVLVAVVLAHLGTAVWALLVVISGVATGVAIGGGFGRAPPPGFWRVLLIGALAAGGFVALAALVGGLAFGPTALFALAASVKVYNLRAQARLVSLWRALAGMAGAWALALL
jgi:hypothetical protein